jgi:hypothetical protein
MTILNGPIIATFLILLAASVAVVGSMIVLALFDVAFDKKRKTAIAVEMTDQDTEVFGRIDLNEPVSNSKAEVGVQSDNVVQFKRTA